MPVQVLFGFNSDHPGKLSGWGEIHYLTGIASPDDIAAKTAAVNAANARVDLLGRGVHLEELRLSATDVRRDSIQLPIGEDGNPLSARAVPADATLTAYGQADLTNVCVLIRMGANSKKWKNMYMAGVPDDLTNTAKKSVDTAKVPLWLTKYNIWRNILAPVGGGQWGYNATLNASDNAAYGDKTILGYVNEGVAPGRMGIVMLTADTGWGVGVKVHIRGVTMTLPRYQSPIGIWQIASKTDDPATGLSTFYLRNSESIPIDQIRDTGTANLVAKGYFTYTFADIQGLGTRKRGVGSSHQVGRSRRKVSRV